ncbi:TPA: tetratricopeptide repeat protein, partial [Klebsiella pneumoniae]
KGEPLEKNDVKARQWFERAANEGHVLAQYNLAVMYSEGLGGDRDLRKARHWADKAAGQGDPEATRLLSILNERGKQSPFEILMVAGGDPAAASHIVPPVRLGADHGVEKPAAPAAETLSETPAAVINTAPTTESVEIIEIDGGSTGVEIEKITEDAPAEEAMPSDALRSQKMENRESEARAGEAENLQNSQRGSTQNNELTPATGSQAVSEGAPREEGQQAEENDVMGSSGVSESVPAQETVSATKPAEDNIVGNPAQELVKTEE